MYTIGEISKIVNLSTDTLRYYDENGLLAPSRIDPTSKYRYYSGEQVKFILLIMELKQYGFTLQEIKDLSRCKNPEVLKSAFCQRLEELKLEVASIHRIIDLFRCLRNNIVFAIAHTTHTIPPLQRFLRA
ncbi:MAG: putative transcriptional regulator [Herbinix sp.]|jgi:DNA-binding transcriptional MerR regulator|nr:putative transcriptional regulator [Herbinix sp.]